MSIYFDLCCLLALLLSISAVMIAESEVKPKKRTSLQSILDKQERLKAEKDKKFREDEELWERGRRNHINESAKIIDTYHHAVRMCLFPDRPGKNCKKFDKEAFKKETSILNFHTNGRLGNQMSSFASLFAYCKILTLRLFLYRSQHEFLSKIFENLDFPILDDHYCDPCALEWEIFPAKKVAVNMKLRTGHAFAGIGYVQEPILYKRFLPMLRHIFTFRDEIAKAATIKVSEAVVKSGKSSPILIGMHVRRTDMLGHVHLYQGHLVSTGYFNKAREYFREKFGRENVLFLMVSDDSNWTRKNLEEEDSIFVGSADDALEDADEISAGIDLAILGMCEHVIMSHGTFGLWGGLLSGGETVMADGFSEKQLEEVTAMKNAAIDGWKFLSEKDLEFVEAKCKNHDFKQ